VFRPIEKDASLFVPDGERYVPTLYCQGPWDPGAQFGGAPAALIATLVEQTPSLVPMQIARLTTDLMRPVPLTPLRADVRVVREGKKIQVVAVSLFAEGVEVTRATAVRLRRAVVDAEDLPDGRFPNPLPTQPKPVDEDIFPSTEPPGSRLAIEYLFEESGGYYRDPNWMRLRVDVIAGQRPCPVATVAYVADTASGTGQVATSPHWINADVAINVVREPVGGWLSLDGRGWIGHTGTGQVQATLSDTEGVVSTISMIRLVDPPTSV
jgi:hypothetical protein